MRQNNGKIRQIDHPVGRNCIPTRVVYHPGGRNCIPTRVVYHPGVGIKFLLWVPITRNRKNTMDVIIGVGMLDLCLKRLIAV